MIKLKRPECPDPKALANDYRAPKNKAALRDACYDKCMYCESYISHVYHGDVEHIVPKSKFPERTNDWNNLGYVCARCNGFKKDAYFEHAPFINPFDENPDDFIFAFGTMIFNHPGNERGDVTIRVIQLNRPGLIERRLERVQALINMAENIAKTRNPELKELLKSELDTEALADKPYSLVSRHAIDQFDL